MNWKKLQEMQKALDESIIKQKDLGMTAEELFKKTVIALTVELAEVANCDEFFKHWKDNKGKVETKRFYSIPRTQREGVEKPQMFADTQSDDKLCTFEEAHHLSLVEECSDCLHFILSIANQIGWEINMVGVYRPAEIDDSYLKILRAIAYISVFDDDVNESDTERIRLRFSILIDRFLTFCSLLGVTQEELEQAYYEKNKVNYERLANGY